MKTFYGILLIVTTAGITSPGMAPSGDTSMLPVEPVVTLTSLLHIYGGWALSAILMVALHHLYRITSKLLEDRHVEFTSVIKEVTAVMKDSSAAAKDSAKSNDRLARAITSLKDKISPPQ